MASRPVRTGRTRTLTVTATTVNTIAFGGRREYSNLYINQDDNPAVTALTWFGNSGAVTFPKTSSVMSGPSLTFTHLETTSGSPGTGTITAALTPFKKITITPVLVRPAAPGVGEVTFSGPVTMTATTQKTAVYQFEECEQVDNGSGSRTFFERIRDDVDSTYTTTATFNGQSLTEETIMRGGFSANLTEALHYFSVAAIARRYVYDDPGRSLFGVGPAFALTGSVTISQSFVGGSIATIGASVSAFNCSASGTGGGATATATAPSNYYQESSASYTQRIHHPQTVVKGFATRRDMLDAELPEPYVTTGTAYFGHYLNENNANSNLVAFSLSESAEIETVFGYGTTIAQAVHRNVTNISVPLVEVITEVVDASTVYYPYASGTAPVGVNWGPLARAGLCAVRASAGGLYTNGDVFAPTVPVIAYKNISNSPALCGVTISQAASIDVASLPFLSGGKFGGTWAASGGAVLNESGGKLSVAAALGSATTATLTLPSTFRVGYRFMRVRVYSVDALGIAVRLYQATTGLVVIGQAASTLTGGGVAEDVIVDLLRTPQNLMVFPFTASSQSDTQFLRRIQIDVPAGKTIEIEFVRWERLVLSTLSITQSALAFSSTSLPHSLPGFSGFTDGMPARCIGRLLTRPDTLPLTLSGRAGQTGWTGVYFGPSNLAGNDLPEAGPIGGEKPRLDVDATGGTVIMGSRTGHGVLAYHACGDVLGQGAYTGDFIARWDTWGGARVTATVVGNVASPTLTAKRETDNAFRASAVFSSPGTVRYGSLLPVFQSFDTTTTGADKTIIAFVTGDHGVVSGQAFRWTPTDFGQSWCGLIFSDESSLWLSMDASATGRLVQATTDAAGKIVLRLPSLFGVASWAETVTTITGTRPTARYAKRRASGELVILYEAAGGGIERVTTENEGGTFTVATTITAAGKFAALDITPTGAEAVAWWVTGGSVKFRTFDAFGTAITAEVTAVASGAAEDAIGLVFLVDGSVVLAYRNAASAIVTVVSTDGGQTWS